MIYTIDLDKEPLITQKKIKKSFGLAISALLDQIQRDAPNANLWEIYHSPIPMAKKYAEKQKLRKDAIIILRIFIDNIHEQ